MLRLTPVLVVDAIEPSLAFWVDRLAFQKLSESGPPGRLESVTLQRRGVELVFQTRGSVIADGPGFKSKLGTPGSVILRIEVENIEEVEKSLQGIEPLVPLRETDYGGAELMIREPGGHVIAFVGKAGY